MGLGMQRSSQPITCSCGHTGFLYLKENDSPFSKSWEEYTLEGFKGSDYVASEKPATSADIIQNMKPVCPKCGKAITELNG